MLILPNCDCRECRGRPDIITFHFPQHFALLEGCRLWYREQLGEVLRPDGAEGVVLKKADGDLIYVRHGSPLSFYMGPSDLTGERNSREVFFINDNPKPDFTSTEP